MNNEEWKMKSEEGRLGGMNCRNGLGGGSARGRRNVLAEKSRSFALRIIKLFKYLQGKHEVVMSKQILRCGTSIGANVAEGVFAQTAEDFVSKNSIALKEARETAYWIDLLSASGYLPDTDSTRTLVSECNELIAILVATVKTAKSHRR